MQSLPIDSLLPKIIEQLELIPNLVLEAPPGAGKTTRVPPALLEAGSAGEGEVWVLEPRRLAARMAARRVAEERGEKLGETIGYQIRFEDVAGPRTRLRFLTEGVLTRRLLSNPLLTNVGTVVLDEFHERHLQADIALALLRRLQESRRPDLKLVVMSATLAAAPIAGFLGDAPVLRSEGKRFEVTIEHLNRPADRPLAEEVEIAVRRLLAEMSDGDILIFLPGAAEIRRAQAACASLAASHNLLILPLHGDLPAAEQDRAVRPSSQRKLILSTNVAESSVTIEGVTAVIDSGLARIAGHSPWSGLPTLNVGRISKASAVQRAGRAGRTRPGRCLRLYTAQDYYARPDHDTAEVHRLDLAEPALELHAAGITDIGAFKWFEAPPQSAIDAAESLLLRLSAIDDGGNVTATGRSMLRYPLHPRQSRLLIEAQARGAGEKASIIAALIGERDVVATELFRAERQPAAPTAGPSDLLDRLDRFEEAARSNFSQTRSQGLDYGAVMAVERVRKQLNRLSEKSGTAPVSEVDQELLISILAGYPDRIARRRSMKSGNAELLLSSGGSASLSPASVALQSEFLVAVDAEERREKGKIVRLASAIEPEWLIDLFPEQLRETTEAEWNGQTERVEVVKRLLYDQLVVDENRTNEASGDEVSRVLSDAALSVGLQEFVDPESVEKFIARIDFVAHTFPEAGLPAFADSDLREALIALCVGLNSFAQLRQATGRGGLLDAMRRKLNPEQTKLIARMAPEQVAIAGRRQVRVNYERGKPPWIASRLQDFYTMHEGPRIAGGRVLLVLHLLAPNQRPVQITTDLAGFWQRTYPQVRRELSRKYPRHRWPENPI
jgi:ATP-dependent RNA helicase HrpB